MIYQQFEFEEYKRALMSCAIVFLIAMGFLFGAGVLVYIADDPVESYKVIKLDDNYGQKDDSADLKGNKSPKEAADKLDDNNNQGTIKVVVNDESKILVKVDNSYYVIKNLKGTQYKANNEMKIKFNHKGEELEGKVIKLIK